MRLSKVGFAAALGCLFAMGVAVLAAPGLVQARQATAAYSSSAQADSPAVRFDGAVFSVEDLAAFAGQPIEVWNDTDQPYMLRVELAVAGGSSAPPALYLPAIMNPNGIGPQADAPTSYDLDFAPGQMVRLTLRPAGNWSVTVLGTDGQPITGALLVVGVTNPATPFPTPTATSAATPGVTPSMTPTPTPGQTPQPTASVTPPAGTPSPVPTIRPGQVEWTYHKTADGAHPDANEQQMMWLMNRARANPAQEGVWLATTPLDDIAGGRDYFKVDKGLLQGEFAGYAAKPPAAFDARIYAGSLAHSLDLIARDAQDHNGQFDRVAAAGFSCWGGRGNVFAYADSALNAHGAFNIDWDGSSDGMQDGRGHRAAIMALDGNYTNVGIALAPDNDPATRVGPLVTTSNYCAADTRQPNHYNRLIVGTVWSDRDEDGLYDPGEGISGVQVNPSAGTYYAITGAAGGYAIPILAPGTYTVHFAVAGGIDQVVTVGEVSVPADLVVK